MTNTPAQPSGGQYDPTAPHNPASPNTASPNPAANPPPGGAQTQPQAQGFIDLTVQGSVMTSSMVVPTVMIDGHHVGAQYGLNTVPVPAGDHHISCYGQWMRRYGQAEMTVNVGPGERVPVFYAAPYNQFQRGSIGHQKQKAKGIGCLLVLLGFIVAMVIFSIYVATLI